MIFTLVKLVGCWIAVYNLHLWIEKESRHGDQTVVFYILIGLQIVALFGLAYNGYLVCKDIENLQVAVYRFLTK